MGSGGDPEGRGAGPQLSPPASDEGFPSSTHPFITEMLDKQETDEVT